VVDGNAIGSPAGPIAGVGRMTTADLMASARGHVLHGCRRGRFADSMIFSHRLHGRAILRLVGCSHTTTALYIGRFKVIIH
jgi:hypothetical protein